MTGSRIVSAVLMAVGLAVMVAGYRSGLGTPSMPGPGAWTLAVGLGLFLSSLASLNLTKGVAPPQALRAGVVRVPAGVLAFALLYPFGGLLSAALGAAWIAAGAFPGPGRRWVLPTVAIATLCLWALLSFELHVPIRLLPFGGKLGLGGMLG